jgi:hypothetical protein
MASPPTYAADWTAYYLTLAAAATAPQQAWIDARLASVWAGLDAAFWGSARDEAALLLVGHYWTLETQAGASGGGATGAVTSKSAGRWAQGNAAPAASRAAAPEGDYAATIWGQRYLALLYSRGAVPLASHL